MTRAALALALAALLAAPATAAPRRKPHRGPVPVTVEGVGTIWISGRPPRRR